MGDFLLLQMSVQLTYDKTVKMETAKNARKKGNRNDEINRSQAEIMKFSFFFLVCLRFHLILINCLWTNQ